MFSRSGTSTIPWILSSRRSFSKATQNKNWCTTTTAKTNYTHHTQYLLDLIAYSSSSTVLLLLKIPIVSTFLPYYSSLIYCAQSDHLLPLLTLPSYQVAARWPLISLYLSILPMVYWTRWSQTLTRRTIHLTHTIDCSSIHALVSTIPLTTTLTTILYHTTILHTYTSFYYTCISTTLETRGDYYITIHAYAPRVSWDWCFLQLHTIQHYYTLLDHSAVLSSRPLLNINFRHYFICLFI